MWPFKRRKKEKPRALGKDPIQVILKQSYANHFNFLPNQAYKVLRVNLIPNPQTQEEEIIYRLKNEDGEKLNINSTWVDVV